MSYFSALSFGRYALTERHFGDVQSHVPVNPPYLSKSSKVTGRSYDFADYAEFQQNYRMIW
jgi:hypothetical protein